MALIVACINNDRLNLKLHMSKRSILISIGAMLCMVLLFYVFVFNYVVPNAAKLSIPYIWRNMPLMQDSSTVHAYLGDPSKQQLNKEFKESWEKGIKDQKYQLNIQYSAMSKLTVSYQIEYHFKKWWIQKDYVLETKDTRQ